MVESASITADVVHSLAVFTVTHYHLKKPGAALEKLIKRSQKCV